MPSPIFISYRRLDSPDFVAHISEKLKTRFGDENVFIDFADIPPGTKWLKHLETEIIGCDVFVIIIGPQWVEIMHDKARNHEPDIVRREIELALEYEKTVVPICIKGAKPPQKKQLPPKLRPLLDFNIAFLNTGNNLEHDFERVANFIATNVPELAQINTDEKKNTPQVSQDISGTGVAIGGNMTGGTVIVAPHNKKIARINQLKDMNRQLEVDLSKFRNQLTQLRRDERINNEIDAYGAVRSRGIRNLVVLFGIMLIALITVVLINAVVGAVLGVVLFGIHFSMQIFYQPEKVYEKPESRSVNQLEREIAEREHQIQQNKNEITRLYNEVNGG